MCLEEEICNVYGFQVTLHNSGNHHVDNPQIEIILHESGQIVEYETQPEDRPGYRVTVDRDDQEKNVLRVRCPYINPGNRLVVRLISTNNVTRDCKVNVLGAGVRTRRRRMLRRVLVPQLAWLSFLVFMFIFYSVQPGEWPSDLMLRYLGAHVETQSVVLFPSWLRRAMSIIGGLLLVWSMHSFENVLTRTRMRGDWDADADDRAGLASVLRRVFG